jgi:hypothetical protein
MNEAVRRRAVVGVALGAALVAIVVTIAVANRDPDASDRAGSTTTRETVTSAIDTKGTSVLDPSTPSLPDLAKFQDGQKSEPRALPYDLSDGTREQLDDLSGIAFELRVERRRIPSGYPLPAALIVHNLTNQTRTVRLCTALHRRFGFVPAATPDLPLRPTDVRDCFRNGPDLVVAPGGSKRWPLQNGWAGESIPARHMVEQFAELGGTIPPGRYRAVADVVGRDSIARAAIPVTVAPHPCGGFDDELARRYVTWDVTDAAARARAEGRPFRVVERDGVRLLVQHDRNCDRISASVRNGRVVAIDIS